MATPKLPEITKLTAIKWRQFLDSDAGKEGMLYLRELTPTIAKGQIHEVAFDGAYVAGYTKCLDRISQVISAEQKGPVNFENK